MVKDRLGVKQTLIAIVFQTVWKLFAEQKSLFALVFA
jgi:chromate transport protein ChrA